MLPSSTPIELLRFIAAGSVDDGKSTLIGRLLHDCKALFDDQLEALRLRASCDGIPDFASLTDGLSEERRRGITLDVAYRYFATPRRRFSVADAPGHVHLTRNMLTGASNADLALLLIDAQHGVVEQTRRHALLAALLRIPHIAVCVNKMDLVGHERGVFDRIREQFSSFISRLEAPDVRFIPISARHGDNVVIRSARMPWYEGPTLLYHLEDVRVGARENLVDCRYPIQMVLRKRQRTLYAGRIASGVFKHGDELKVLPSGRKVTVKAIEVLGSKVSEAFAGQSVALELTDNTPLERGDMLVREFNAPLAGKSVELMLCWIGDQELAEGDRYIVRHATRETPCRVEVVRYRLDVRSLHRRLGVLSLRTNDIGRVALRLSRPLFCDPYRRCRTGGRIIVLDPATGETLGAGLVI